MKHLSQALNAQDVVNRMADAVEEIDAPECEPAL